MSNPDASDEFLHGRILTTADRYRVERPDGNSRRRWYVDPHDTCEVAVEARSLYLPSVSDIKGAHPSDWSGISRQRNSVAYAADHTIFDDCTNAIEIAKRMNQIDTDGLRNAGRRGTNVHTIIESKLKGLDHGLPADALGMDYYDTCMRMLDALAVEEVLALEFVVFNRTMNGHGFGGTSDALLRIGGLTYIVDWKSRTARTGNTCSGDDVAQVGGYSLAEYICDGERRRYPVRIDGAIIVSIAPEEYGFYVIDIDAARRHFTNLHSWWTALKTQKEAVGRVRYTMADEPKPKAAKPKKPKPDIALEPATIETVEPALEPAAIETPVEVAAPVEILVERSTWLRARCKALASFNSDAARNLSALWPSHIPALINPPHTADELAEISELIGRIETDFSVPFYRQDPTLPVEQPMLFDTPPTVTPQPDEGDIVPDDDEMLSGLRQRYAALEPDSMEWLKARLNEAADAHRSINTSGNQTRRRIACADALVTLAADGWQEPDLTAKVIRSLLDLGAQRSGNPLTTSPDETVGAQVSALDSISAATLAFLSRQFADGVIVIDFVDNEPLLRYQWAGAPYTKNQYTKTGEQS